MEDSLRKGCMIFSSFNFILNSERNERACGASDLWIGMHSLFFFVLCKFNNIIHKYDFFFFNKDLLNMNLFFHFEIFINKNLESTSLC